MRSAFNLGVGLIAILNEQDASIALNTLSDEHPFVIGSVIRV